MKVVPYPNAEVAAKGREAMCCFINFAVKTQAGNFLFVFIQEIIDLIKSFAKYMLSRAVSVAK